MNIIRNALVRYRWILEDRLRIANAELNAAEASRLEAELAELNKLFALLFP